MYKVIYNKGYIQQTSSQYYIIWENFKAFLLKSETIQGYPLAQKKTETMINRIKEFSDARPHNCSQRSFYKDAKNRHWKRDSMFNKWSLHM